MPGKATAEDVRHALVHDGLKDLATRWSNKHKARRGAAHPDPHLDALVLQALNKRSGPSPSEGTVDSPFAHDGTSTASSDNFEEMQPDEHHLANTSADRE